MKKLKGLFRKKAAQEASPIQQQPNVRDTHEIPKVPPRSTSLNRGDGHIHLEESEPEKHLSTAQGKGSFSVVAHVDPSNLQIQGSACSADNLQLALRQSSKQDHRHAVVARNDWGLDTLSPNNLSKLLDPNVLARVAAPTPLNNFMDRMPTAERLEAEGLYSLVDPTMKLFEEVKEELDEGMSRMLTYDRRPCARLQGSTSSHLIMDAPETDGPRAQRNRLQITGPPPRTDEGDDESFAIV